MTSSERWNDKLGHKEKKILTYIKIKKTLSSCWLFHCNKSNIHAAECESTLCDFLFLWLLSNDNSWMYHMYPIICWAGAHDKDSLFLGSKRICHVVLCVFLHTTTHSSPAAALTTGQREGNPWHPNLLEAFLKSCVFMCVHVKVCLKTQQK